jgi:hypothetical protein
MVRGSFADVMLARVAPDLLGRASLGLIAAFLSTPAGAQGVALPRPDLPLPLDRATVGQAGSVRSDPSLRLPDSAATGDLRPMQTPDAVRQGVTVQDRPRPEYSNEPARVGAFLLTAEAGARLGYDVNVFRQRDDGASDGYGLLTATGRLASDTPRHLLLLEGAVAERAYAKFTTESGFTYMGHAGGRLDLGLRDSLSLDVRHEHQMRERNTATEILSTRRPVVYDLTSFTVSGHKMVGRVGIDLAGVVSRLNYDDAETPNRVPIDLDVRNSRSYGARLDVSYELGTGPIAFAAVRTERRRYDTRVVQGQTRDSNQYEFLAGLRGEIAPLLRGQIGVGYIHAELKDGRAAGGPSVDGRLDYLLTDLTTISFEGRRELRNVASITTPEALASRFTLQVDHELLRNLILSATAGYDRASYLDEDGGSTEIEGRFGATYLINRRFRLTGSIGYRNRNGFGRIADRDYNQLAGNIGVVARL